MLLLRLITATTTKSNRWKSTERDDEWRERSERIGRRAASARTWLVVRRDGGAGALARRLARDIARPARGDAQPARPATQPARRVAQPARDAAQPARDAASVAR